MNRKRLLFELVPVFVMVLGLGTARAGQGTPDALGWSWTDSDEFGIDLSIETPLSLTPIAASLPDDGVFPVNLGFNFTLYGQTASTVYFSTNGWISLIDPLGNSAPNNTNLPDASTPPNATIAYLWDDHDGAGAGSFAQSGPTANGHLFFMRHVAKVTGAISQLYVHLYRNNTIKVFYIAVPSLSTSTIGIENELGGVGQSVGFNGVYSGGANVRDSYAILFYPASTLDCSAAIDLLCPMPIAGTTLGGPASTSSYSCDPAPRAGAERVYSVVQRRDGRFQASLSNLGGRDLALYLVGGACHPGFQCAAGGSTSIDIPNLKAGNYFVVVDGATALDDGDFTLLVTPLDSDCNRNSVNDSCDILLGTSTDCNDDGRPDECGNCAVDVVFTMDTSGSMNPYFAPLCSAIAATVAQLNTEGIDFTAQAWGITDNGSTCLTDNVRNALGTTVPGSPTPPLNTLTSSESWGQAASIIAGLYPWTPNATRVVVPIGDEGPYLGTPVNDPGDDRDVVTHAISVCVANRVIASPITPSISNPQNDLLAQDLAAGTGGTWSSTGTNMGDILLDLVRGACEIFLPSAEAGPDVTSCAPINVRLDGSASRPTCNAGGIEYHWLDGTNEPCGTWSTIPTCDVSPTATTTYTLEVRCITSPSCFFQDTVTITPAPSPIPMLTATPIICLGDPIILDASGTNPNGCPGGVEYQFSDTGILQMWSGAATHGPLMPATSTTYTVETRCLGSTMCPTTTTYPVDVVSPPIARVSPDVDVCGLDPVLLDASTSTTGSCPGGPLYEWWQGTTLVRPATSDPTYVPPTLLPGTLVYTVVVSCASLSGCDDSASVRVLVRDCSLSVKFDAVAAIRTDTTHVAVRWRTVSELGTVLFAVERAMAPSGPFAMIASTPALGSGSSYEVVDEVTDGSASIWYRVVEHTVEGRGDQSPVVEAVDQGAGSGGGRARRRR